MDMDKNIYLMNECQIYYFGYILCKDGRILSPSNVELKKFNIVYEQSHVSMIIDGKEKKENAARLIYRYFTELLYHEAFNQKGIIYFKDGDKTNTAYSNLEIITRSEFDKRNNDSHIQKKFAPEVVKEIKEKYACKPGKRDKLKNQYQRETPSMRNLCQEYGCSLTTMKKILDNKY